MNTTTKALRTNSKEVKEKIQKYILECIDLSEQNCNDDSDKGKIQFLYDEFKRVSIFPYNLQYFKTYQRCFMDFCQGLPSYFNIEFYDNAILEQMSNFGLPLPENKTNEQGIQLYYDLLYINFMDLCKKYNVKVSY